MTEQNSPLEGEAVVAWLRQVSPYFHKHRAQTFVVYFGGEAVADAGFTNLTRDLLMLAAPRRSWHHTARGGCAAGQRRSDHA